MITSNSPILFRGNLTLKNPFSKPGEESDLRFAKLLEETPSVLHPLLRELIALKEGNHVFKRLSQAEKQQEISGFRDEKQSGEYSYQNIIISHAFRAYNELNVDAIKQAHQLNIQALPELLYDFTTGDYAQVNIYKYPGTWKENDTLLPFSLETVTSQKKHQFLTELQTLYQSTGLSLMALKNDLDSLLINPATGDIVIGPWQSIAPTTQKDFHAIIKKIKAEFQIN